MDENARRFAVIILFMIGAGIGFYLARLFF